jgi:hypothetical protein
MVKPHKVHVFDKETGLVLSWKSLLEN